MDNDTATGSAAPKPTPYRVFVPPGMWNSNMLCLGIAGILGSCDQVERQLAEIAAAKGLLGDESYLRAQSYLRQMRKRAKAAPDIAIDLLVYDGIAFGISLASMGADQAMRFWEREQKRRLSAGRKPAIDPAHLLMLRERAAKVAAENPEFTKTQVVLDNCDWYRLEHQRTVSPSTMRGAIAQELNCCKPARKKSRSN